MIIPVLDLMNGRAVSGKSGKRETYKDLETIFHPSADPISISLSLKKNGANRIYIADLDSIESKGSNLELVKEINNILPVILDCGINNQRDVEKALKVADKVIIASETVRSVNTLQDIFKTVNNDRLVLSVDVKGGKLFSKYLSLKLEELIELIHQIKPKEVILLDISRVGTLQGVDKDLISKFKNLESSILLGGGIKGNEIEFLYDQGIVDVLVGSSLHRGNLSLEGRLL